MRLCFFAETNGKQTTSRKKDMPTYLNLRGVRPNAA